MNLQRYQVVIVDDPGIPSSSLDHSVASTETPANGVEFKVGDRVNLLDINDDVIVAIARIISIP